MVPSNEGELQNHGLSRTEVSTPSSSSCVSAHDEDSSPGDRVSWMACAYIPPSIEDGQSRFGFIEEALAGASESQLLSAEERCKTSVLESDECSAERRWLVQQLVELRLRLQEVREGSEAPPAVRLVLGHHMQLQQSAGPASAGGKQACDRCCGAIWAVIHSWYLCRDCGYACHARCLAQVARTCVHVVVSERPQFELRICPEVGLAKDQNFHCAECRTHITFKHSWLEPRLCDYSGHHFCANCHWNSSSVIPARVVRNWDFAPRKVSRAARTLIRLLADRPVLPLKDINPRLFNLVEELSVVQGLRDSLRLMKQYLVTCRLAADQRLLWQLRSRQHLLDSAHLYSLRDLQDIHSGELLPFLTAVHQTFAAHITRDCKQCQGRGYVCELCDCNDDEVLFPFDSGVERCSACRAVFHRACWSRRAVQSCTRCQRLSERAAARLSAASPELQEEPEPT